MENISSKSSNARKIRIVWSNGQVDYFYGKIEFKTNDKMWKIEQLSGGFIYIPAYNVRTINIVTDDKKCGNW